MFDPVGTEKKRQPANKSQFQTNAKNIWRKCFMGLNVCNTLLPVITDSFFFFFNGLDEEQNISEKKAITSHIHIRISYRYQLVDMQRHTTKKKKK